MTVKHFTKVLDYSWQLFLFLFQMLLFKVCIGVVSPFIYVFAQYYGATVLSHYCSLHYLFLYTKFPILLAAFWAVFPTLSLRHSHMVYSRWPASSLALLSTDCLLPSSKWILLMEILPEYSFIDSRNVRKLTKTYIHMSKLMSLRRA